MRLGGRHGVYRLRLGIGAVLVALVLGAGIWIVKHPCHDRAREERQRQTQQRLLECSRQPRLPQSNVCLFAPLESCERLTLYTLDDSQVAQRASSGVSILTISPRGSTSAPPPSEHWPAMFPTNLILGNRELSEVESKSLLALWREQHLQPLQGDLSCECRPHYGLACADGETLRLAWKICYFCQKIDYETSQPRVRGQVLFDEHVPQSQELRQELQRLLPHPHADVIEKTMKQKHAH